MWSAGLTAEAGGDGEGHVRSLWRCAGYCRGATVALAYSKGFNPPAAVSEGATD